MSMKMLPSKHNVNVNLYQNRSKQLEKDSWLVNHILTLGVCSLENEIQQSTIVLLFKPKWIVKYHYQVIKYWPFELVMASVLC